MALRSLDWAGGEDWDEAGSNLAGSTDSARAHPHMPRCGVIILTRHARASSPKAARQDGPAP